MFFYWKITHSHPLSSCVKSKFDQSCLKLLYFVSFHLVELWLNLAGSAVTLLIRPVGVYKW